MSTVHAIYENGVFRPVEPVALPENCEVEFEPRVVAPAESSEQEMSDIYGILSERFESGEHDVAQRHNEHQP